MDLENIKDQAELFKGIVLNAMNEGRIDDALKAYKNSEIKEKVGTAVRGIEQSKKTLEQYRGNKSATHEINNAQKNLDMYKEMLEILEPIDEEIRKAIGKN